MIDLAVLAGKYLKAKFEEGDDPNIQSLANIIYVDTEIGKAQKKISLNTAGGTDDEVNPKTEIDLQVICTDSSTAKAKEIGNAVNNILDGLYYANQDGIIFSSASTSVIVPAGNIGGGNYATIQHFRIVQGAEK